MHLSNVADFAPPGYRLERSDMGSGCCRHRFVAEGKPELVCEGSWASADEERAALERFKRERPFVEAVQHSTAALLDDAERRSAQRAELLAALDEGDASPVSPDYSLEKVLAKIDAVPAKPKATPKGKR